MYLPRTVGLSISFIATSFALFPMDLPTWAWGLMIGHCFAWPHLAYRLASRAERPFNVERRSFLVDSFFSGLWAGGMGFNVLPSVTLLSLMCMNNLATGGYRLFSYGLIAQIIGATSGCIFLMQSWMPVTSQAEMLACVPMLIVYPLALGIICYNVALRMSEHRKELKALSTTDTLTHLLNQGAWKEQLSWEFRKPPEQACCLALIDVDFFKRINDSYGHIVGDNVLAHLSSIMATKLRDTDLLGRYGGDEFCVILPNTDLSQAVKIMDDLRSEASSKPLLCSPHMKITLSISIGVAARSGLQSTSECWLNEADIALYAAKSKGRNRVEAH